MKPTHLAAAAGLLVTMLCAASNGAQASSCRTYTRIAPTDIGDQLAEGTACLSPDGQWRVVEEHLASYGARTYAPPPVVAYYPTTYYVTRTAPPRYRHVRYDRPQYFTPYPSSVISIRYDSRDKDRDRHGRHDRHDHNSKGGGRGHDRHDNDRHDNDRRHR